MASDSGGDSPLFKRPRSNLIEDLSTNVPGVRIKVYPVGSKGPFLVFMRKKKLPLGLLRISQDLKKYGSVIQIKQAHQDKIRITLGDRDEANRLVQDPSFTSDYKLYVPSDNVEVQGVIYDRQIECETLTLLGTGKFKDPRLKQVPIMECQRLMERSTNEDGVEEFVLSSAIKVTFEGTVLPHYVNLDKVLVPVRPFSRKPMHCDRCKRFGHTNAYCPNKAKCAKCGDRHNETTCSAEQPKCAHCKQAFHSVEQCTVFKMRQTKERRRARESSRRSYAEALKTLPPVESPNKYDALMEDSDDDEEPNETTAEPVPPGKSSPATKKKKPAAQQSSSPPVTSPRKMNEKAPREPAPGLRAGCSSTNHQNDQPSVESFVTAMMEFFDAPSVWKAAVLQFVPLLDKIWRKIIQKVPQLVSLLNL